MPFLLYGSYGYTGSLIAEEAKSRGMDVILAGRDKQRLLAQASRLDLQSRIVDLSDDAAVDSALNEVTAVLNCAGPFVDTAFPMVEGCFRTNTHYLDITGELSVLQELALWHNRARANEITLLPAVGFDVVPTDCIAARLSDRLPGADVLELAILSRGSYSRGTAKTAVEQAGMGAKVRYKGELRSVPPLWRKRNVDFGRGPTEVVSIALPDLITAHYSAQVPTIITYAHLPREAKQALRLSRYLGWMLQLKPIKEGIKGLLDRQPRGPKPKERQQGESYVWGQAATENGDAVISRLHGPDTYNFTVASALEAVERAVYGSLPHGFQTPATAFGHSFVEGIAGVTVEDVQLSLGQAQPT